MERWCPGPVQRASRTGEQVHLATAVLCSWASCHAWALSAFLGPSTCGASTVCHQRVTDCHSRSDRLMPWSCHGYRLYTHSFVCGSIFYFYLFHLLWPVSQLPHWLPSSSWVHLNPGPVLTSGACGFCVTNCQYTYSLH